MKRKKINIKKYYRIIFEIISPLSIGNGENEITDNDIILDSRGMPYIPGSALAGAYRNLFERETSDRYFGKDMTEELIKEMSDQGKNLLTESKLIVYDAEILNPEDRNIAVYDMVALDEFKVSIPGAKFDFQVLEPGIQFVTYIEQNMDEIGEAYLTEEILSAWETGKIKLGAKTGRGYGQTKIVKIEEITFSLSQEYNNQIQYDGKCNDWIEFDIYEDSGWKECQRSKCLSRISAKDVKYQELKDIYQKYEIFLRKKEEIRIILYLKQAGGISVRQYSAKIDQADYRQMSRIEKERREVFIPGTTWAGAFRAQMGKLDSNFAKNTSLTELFFGNVNGKDNTLSYKTRITFSESKIEEGEWRTYTRNAIDRFSGGTIDGALYTEETYFNGKTELDISCDITDIDREKVRRFCSVLAAAILDLDRGYMAVGGLTAVGHGLFKVTGIEVNGEKVLFKSKNEECNEEYVVIKTALAGCVSD